MKIKFIIKIYKSQKSKKIKFLKKPFTKNKI